LEVNPGRVNLRIKIGELLIKEKKYEEAQKEFQEVLKSDPDNREVRIALGILYYDLRRFDLAVAEFSIILEKNINDNRIRYLLASAYEEKGDNKFAIDEYRKIPATSELYSSAQIHAAMIFKKEGKITEAIDLVNEARFLYTFICLHFMKKQKMPLRL
jgi:tetratricopeptide (TPR) repeat protein